jgi:HEAT repeat protein
MLDQRINSPASETAKKLIYSLLQRFKGEKMLEKLILQLKSEDQSIRTKAARALGKSGEKNAVEFLIRALHDDNRHVRRAASGALGQTWSEDAVMPLCAALKDADWFVR